MQTNINCVSHFAGLIRHTSSPTFSIPLFACPDADFLILGLEQCELT